MKFRPLLDGRKYAPWLAHLASRSGVYCIRAKEGGEMLYIGESHSDSLLRTLTRHFQHWTGETSGPTFSKSKVEVAIVFASKDTAVDKQNALISEHQPKHNIEGKPKGFWEKVEEWLDEPF